MINQQLVEENLDLVKKVSNNLKFPELPTFTYDDFLQAGYEALCTASEKYDSSKNPNFGNYVAIRIRWGIINQYRKQFLVPTDQVKKYNKPKAVFVDVNLLDDDFYPAQLTFEDKLEILDDIIKTLSSRQKEFIYKKYWLGYTQQEIAEELNLVHSDVRQTLNNALKKMRKALE